MSPRLLLSSHVATALLLSAGTALAGAPPFGLENFEPLAAIEDLPLTELTPDVPVDYVALRLGWSGLNHQVLSSAGASCAQASDPAACEAALEAERPGYGFQYGCLPASCYKYLVYTRGDEIGVITSPAALRTFLGTIDNPTEALLMAAAHEYWWNSSDVQKGAIRSELEYFELILNRLTRDCDPIETTGYLVRVSRCGQVEELQNWVIQRQDGVCI